jgi:hypothetical protein
MRLRPHRQNLVVWGTSVGPAIRYGAPRPAPLPRTKRIRRSIRTGTLLTIMGLMRPARIVQTGRQARKRYSELEHELAAFSTPAQRCDLEATLDLYPDSITYELRDILARQAMATYNNRILGAGRY